MVLWIICPPKEEKNVDAESILNWGVFFSLFYRYVTTIIS